MSRFNTKDRFFHKAKDEGFKARSVYKLSEIQQKYKVLKSGQNVIDLGCSPGSWSQYAHEQIGPSGKLLGIDLKPVDLKLARALFFQGNIIEEMNSGDFQVKIREFFGEEKVNVVVSDMAPNTTGIKSVDQARSLELCEMALDVAERFLKPHGAFVAKLFHSQEFTGFRKKLESSFEKVYALKPEATRSISKEIFLVALKKR